MESASGHVGERGQPRTRLKIWKTYPTSDRSSRRRRVLFRYERPGTSNVSAVKRERSREGPHQGGLAGAPVAQQRNDFAWVDVQVDSGQANLIPVLDSSWWAYVGRRRGECRVVLPLVTTRLIEGAGDLRRWTRPRQPGERSAEFRVSRGFAGDPERLGDLLMPVMRAGAWP